MAIRTTSCFRPTHSGVCAERIQASRTNLFYSSLTWRNVPSLPFSWLDVRQSRWVMINEGAYGKWLMKENPSMELNITEIHCCRSRSAWNDARTKTFCETTIIFCSREASSSVTTIPTRTTHPSARTTWRTGVQSIIWKASTVSVDVDLAWLQEQNATR